MKEYDYTFIDNSDKALQELAEKSDVILEAWGLLGERYAKELCPVDTGRLRNSITHAQDENSELIGTNVEYAKYVELGASAKHTTGKAHFLRDAVLKHDDEYIRIINKLMRNA